MSYSQSWLEDTTRPRGLLIVAKARNLTTSTEQTFYFSSMPFITGDGVVFNPVISKEIEITESIDITNNTGGISYGTIELHNVAGQFDDYVDETKWVWTNRSLKIYYGDPSWSVNTITDLDTVFLKIFDGLTENCLSAGKDLINLILRDKQELLNVALTENTIGTTGTWYPTQTNTDNIRPIVFGEVHNMTPISIDPSTLKYIFHDEKEQNIITFSQDFTFDFTPTNVRVYPASIAAPDGTITGSYLAESTTSTAGGLLFALQKSFVFSAGKSYTLSAYIKPGTRTRVGLGFNSANGFISTNSYMIVNLSTETITRHDSGLASTSISNAGNGWYRISATTVASPTPTGSFSYVFLLVGGTSDTALTRTVGNSNIDGLYIWGLQVTESKQPLPYCPTETTFTSRASTASYINAAGRIITANSNVARNSYTSYNTSLPPYLLIESSATNVCLHSENLTASPNWTSGAGVVVTANTVTSPDGTVDADTITEASSNTRHWVGQSVSITGGAAYTVSAFLKRGTRDYAGIVVGKSLSPSNRAGYIVNLIDGTITENYSNGTALSHVYRHPPVQYIDGWWRVAVTIVSTVSGGSNFTDGMLEVWPHDTGTTSPGFGAGFYTGNGTGTIYAWGFQLEEGYSPSSYIPTTSTRAARAADIVTSSSGLSKSTHEQLIEIRDNGYPVYRFDGDTSGATVSLADGTFVLTRPPAGAITCSVQGAKYNFNISTGYLTASITYRNSIVDTIHHLIRNYGTLAVSASSIFGDADIDSANFQQVLSSFTTAPRCGYLVADKLNLLQVIQELATSIGCMLHMNRSGKFQLIRTGVPTSDQTVTITSSDIVANTLAIARKTTALGAIKLAYAKNWTTQNNLQTYIAEQLRNDFIKEWFEKTVTSSTALSLYRVTSDPSAKNTYLINTDDATTEATRLLNYYSTPKTVFSFIGTSKLISLNLGQQVLLVHPRFGLSSGKTGQVVKITPRWIRGLVDIEVIV